MNTISRRALVRAGSAAALGVLAGAPARAQAAVALRMSSSMTADDNAAHYVWYQRMDANLKAAGLAEKIRNIDEGNGCEVPNAWKVQALGRM